MTLYYLLNERGYSYWWFKIIGTNPKLIPFSVWAEKVSKTQILNYYDKIVKDVIMVIFYTKLDSGISVKVIKKFWLQRDEF